MNAMAVTRRLAGMAVVVLGVTMITFAISHLIPGDPAQLLAGPRAGAATVARIRADLGLDQPLVVQYGRYLGDLLRGDFGASILTGRPVLRDLMSVFPATLELIVVALGLSVAAGVGLGTLSAAHRGSWIDYAVRVLASLSISIPAFWLALVLLLGFYGVLGVLPGDGRLGVDFDPPAQITGFYLVDSLLTGNVAVFADALAHIALPALTLALVSVGGVIRVIRSSMIEVLNEDYVRTALASGLRRRTVIFDHALRNALIPFVTVLGLEAAALLFGAVVVETVFVWPGAGSYVLSAIFALDFPVIMGFTVVVSIAYVLINTGVDLLYRAINPLLREAGR
jgi:peptide/nickel transport system permease protein